MPPFDLRQTRRRVSVGTHLLVMAQAIQDVEDWRLICLNVKAFPRYILQQFFFRSDKHFLFKLLEFASEIMMQPCSLRRCKDQVHSRQNCHESGSDERQRLVFSFQNTIDSGGSKNERKNIAELIPSVKKRPPPLVVANRTSHTEQHVAPSPLQSGLFAHFRFFPGSGGANVSRTTGRLESLRTLPHDSFEGLCENGLLSFARPGRVGTGVFLLLSFIVLQVCAWLKNPFNKRYHEGDTVSSIGCGTFYTSLYHRNFKRPALACFPLGSLPTTASSSGAPAGTQRGCRPLGRCRAHCARAGARSSPG